MKQERRAASEIVAIILAAGLAVSLITITVTLFLAASISLTNGFAIMLGERGLILLTGWGGGIIGVLGSYIGYTFGKHKGPNG